ncbi:MAG: DUF3102 domain-containing protein [Methylocella sp.]|jgi:hypothetical protein
MTDGQVLDLLASTIDSLRKHASESILEIGFRLIEAKALVEHGKWLPWLKSNFNWSDDTALNYMRIYELSKNRNFRDLDLPDNLVKSSLYLLAGPKTPPKALAEVAARIKAGLNPTVTEVKHIVADAKADAKTLDKQPLAPDMSVKKVITTAEKREIAKLPLKQTVAALIAQYGFGAVSDAVLEYTP